jgi:hypothetical protein
MSNLLQFLSSTADIACPALWRGGGIGLDFGQPDPSEGAFGAH